jgi:ATP-dependent helicase/nuclease subunit A
MRTPDNIPPIVRQRQTTAADPNVSAWVAANAGSGKTHVLAQRVVNLLLQGVAPEKILCITFTKAAAANMAKRVFDTLAEWTRLDDAALDDAICNRATPAPDAARRALARQLFARALETPGGLKVQTIHAFCTQILHQFPFEANVAARFTVLDETRQTQLLEQLTLQILLEGSRDPSSPIGTALGTAMTAAADQTFRDLIREAIGRRHAISRWVVAAGGVAAAVAALSRALGVHPAETRESIEEQFFSGSSIHPDEWAVLAAALGQGAKTDAEQASRFHLLATLSPSDRVKTYLEIFCTSEGAARKSLVTRAIKNPELEARLVAEQDRVCALLGRQRAVACRDRSAALLIVTHEVLARYESEKERRGLADYDDLIDKTLALLTKVEASWVHYKLDFGIDHLLIDEAQDTSSKQWEIVRRLVAEFTAGLGARDARRTIFAVGDEKQSIYSFQNAAPKEFADMQRYFQAAHDAIELEFVPVQLEHSFRSGAAILRAVDVVFKDIAVSVSSDTAGFPAHMPLPDAAPSFVEIWEPTEPDPRPQIEGWDAPFDQVNETSPRMKLAKRIARTVRRLVESREPVGIERRGARYGDILVLVRQRGELFDSIIRALKNERVEVAGADRLILTEHIAVMDLMALADALLLPQDDLAFATVLRSPLFGFEDDDLFAIAWDRGRLSLRAALAGKAGDGEKFATAIGRLDALAARARRETPFAFYAQILGAGGGRQRFLARLGMEANDALDEFLNLALDYERSETPSLQGFVAWLREARAEVKRDMEIARDEVRVMTVHGAKGLEAPIVFLADTMTSPTGKPPRLLNMANALIWAGRKAEDAPPVAAARQAALTEAEHEYRRLLYVAMTRAADRLVVCGAKGANKPPDRCWYDLVCGPLKPMLIEEIDGDEKVLRFRNGEAAAVAADLAPPSEKARSRPELPAWLRESAPPEPERAAPLSPSSAFDEEIGQFAHAGVSAVARQKALHRGRVVHRLLQSLPDIPPPRRDDALDGYLARSAGDFSAAEQAEIAQQVSAILNDAGFAEVFALGSRAEVPIVGRLPRPDAEPLAVAGQVDRLAITNDAVLIADYKTDRVVPAGGEDIATAYLRQLALYRAVLARLYPEKIIRAALVFTSKPSLIHVAVPLLEAELAAMLAKNRHAGVSVA